MNNDLISRSALLKKFETLKNNTNNNLHEVVFLDGAMSVIDAAPAVDAEPVRHGYWKDRGNNLECSECGREYTKYDREGSVIAYYWCPNCGAKMHVERDG